MVEITWTGAAGLVITQGHHTVLIDPYVSRPPKIDVFFRSLKPDKPAIENFVNRPNSSPDAIIVSHTHFDHVLDVPEIARCFSCPVLGGTSLDNLMTISGLPGRTNVCSGGERTELAGGETLTMIPSKHGLVFFGRVPYQGEINTQASLPFKAGEYRLGEMFMPKLEIGGTTIMHAGSANCMVSELDGHRCDVLFMCVPGWKRSREYTTTLLDILRPEVIVPFHFDDFTAPIRGGRAPVLPFTHMPQFREQVLRVLPDVKIRIPRLCSPMSFQ